MFKYFVLLYIRYPWLQIHSIVLMHRSVGANCEQSLNQTSSLSHSWKSIYIPPFTISIKSRIQDWCPLAVLSTKSRSRLMSSLSTGFTSLLYSSPRTTIFWRSSWINLISCSTKVLLHHHLLQDLSGPYQGSIVYFYLFFYLSWLVFYHSLPLWGCEIQSFNNRLVKHIDIIIDI